MGKEDLISIIVPIHNVENYLIRCIESIIGQTYKNIEIILVDDGSKDSSGDICEEYSKKDKRILVIHKENGGLSDARNFGIKAAKGVYITTIDGDDFVEKQYVENLYTLLKKYDSDISSTNRIDFFDTLENGIKNKITFYENFKGDKLYNNGEYTKEILEDRLPHEAWAKLYKKELFDIEQYKKGVSVYEDIEFLLRLLKSKPDIKIACNMECYDYLYRRRENSLSSGNYNLNWTNEIKFYANLLEDKSYIKYSYAISNLIGQKIVRNFFKIAKTTQNKDDLKEVMKFIDKTKLRHCKGKKNFLKLTAVKYFPKTLFKLLSSNKNEKRFIESFKKYIRNNNEGKCALIFNGPTTGNIGDHAILFAEEIYLQKKGITPFLVSSIEMEYFYRNSLEELVPENATIYITGGGNTGSLWRNEQTRINKVLESFSNNKIVIFPQTIYYSNDDFGKECLCIDKKYYSKCRNIEFQCRDKKTFDFVNNNIGIPTIMSKDIALTLDYTNLNYKRTGILFCFRKDQEKVIDDDKKQNLINKIIKDNPKEKIKYIDTVITNKKNYSYKEAKKEFDKIIKIFASSKLVVTDRLHGMIIANITGTKCIALNNLSGKVKGVYDTIKDKNNSITFIEDISKI